MLQEVARVVLATKEANEQERQRRIAWEQEQEAKYAQRQAEFEKELLELRTQVSVMQACMTMTSIPPQANQIPPSVPPSPVPSGRIEELPTLTEDISFTAPSTPGIRSPFPSSPPPVFVQGSSSRPLDAYASPPASSQLSHRTLPTPFTPSTLHSPQPTYSIISPSSLVQSPTRDERIESPRRQIPPLPSPAQTPVVTPVQPSGRSKRRTPALDQSGDEGLDSDADSNSKRRKNGHDVRCLTIQVSCVSC